MQKTKGFYLAIIVGVMLVLVISSLVLERSALNKVKKQSQENTRPNDNTGKVEDNKHEEAMNVSEWKTFTSKKCHFSFRYPNDGSKVGSGWLGVMNPEDACDVGIDFVNRRGMNYYFIVRPLPLPVVSQMFNPRLITEKDVKKFDAKRVAEEILYLNKNINLPNTKKLDPNTEVKELNIGRRKAYSITFTNGYFDWRGDQYALDKEEEHVYISDDIGNKYEIFFRPVKEYSIKFLKVSNSLNR